MTQGCAGNGADGGTLQSYGQSRAMRILAGLSVLTFVHTKTGALHQLTGKDGAEYIGFTATADYQEDDTWELNGVPLDGVDFMNGEPLCVGGLIAGDTVMGRVVDGTLTLFLDRPASNPNILDKIGRASCRERV